MKSKKGEKWTKTKCRITHRTEERKSHEWIQLNDVCTKYNHNNTKMLIIENAKNGTVSMDLVCRI